MPETRVRPSFWFWLVSAGLLLWGIGGATIYVAYFVETPDQFASTAETAANREAYARYVESIPWWAIAAGIAAAASRLLGAVGLLLRRAWALPLFVFSAIAFAVVLYRAFVMADVASVMNPGHVAIEVVFLSLSLFAIWFTRANMASGVLR
jgi:hypothetical protein